MVSMVTNLLDNGSKGAQLFGTIMLLTIIFISIFALHSLDKDHISAFDTICSLLYQGLVIISLTINFTLLYSITAISLILLPFIEDRTASENSKAIKLRFKGLIVGAYFLTSFTNIIFITYLGDVRLDPNPKKYFLFFLFSYAIFLAVSINIYGTPISFKIQVLWLRIKRRCHNMLGMQPICEACAICLMEMDPYAGVQMMEHQIDFMLADVSELVITPCNHYYHAKCLKMWIRHRQVCPIDLNQIPYFILG
jgi:hypothetical protein